MNHNTLEHTKEKCPKPKEGYFMPNNIRSILLHATAAALIGGGFLWSSPASAQVTAQQADVQSRIADENLRRLDEEDAASSARQSGPGVITDEIGRRELPPRGGATVLLRSVTIGPESAFLTEEELAPIKAKYRGERVDFSQISELVRDVNDLYAEKGIVTAAAILPPQNLNAGNLQIRLVEGQVGNVALVGDRTSTDKFVFDRITLAKGTTVDVPTASKDIELFNATNRAQLRLLLQPGAAFGYTDLLLGITEPRKSELEVFYDNQGVTSTGEWQVSGLYRRYGLMGIDDTFLTYLSFSQGSTSGTLRYELPINKYGTRLAASVTASDIAVVSGPTTVLNIEGQSKSANLSLSHPLIIDDRWTVLGTASAFSGTSTSASAGVPLVDSKTVKYAPGVTLSYRGDNGSVATQIQGVFAKSTDNIASTDRDIFLLAGSFNGQYRFANGLTYVGTGAWQHSNDDLLPGNLLFQIGGPTTVRGYPSDGVAGDSGYYVSSELHKQFDVQGKAVDGFVFADFGEVYSTFPSHTSLVSAGIGVNYSFTKYAKGTLSIAAPIKQSLSNQSDYVISAMLVLSAF
jgi:hemolysin activation/secretion protein